MRWLCAIILGLAAAFSGLASPALADVVTSTEMSDVAVSIYRDPYRDSGAMNAGWPGGYALITETRTITLQPGENMIRFENVAEGLLPETAIITGLPKGVREKNRDARLISPAGLVDANLKRRVMIRRTNPATGKVTESEGIIQSGPDGGVTLRTANGLEALRCSGLPERMIYGGIPDGLTAKPTLSVLTRADKAVTATVQLTYMAQGFDWSANYVANIAPTSGKMGLFAWLTVANGGQQSFPNARMQVIAGKPNKRPNNPPPPPASAYLNLQCWPADITSTHPKKEFVPIPLPPGNDLSRFNSVGRNEANSFISKKERKRRAKAARYQYDDESAGEIVVTGSAVGGGYVRRSRPSKRMAAGMMAPEPVAAPEALMEVPIAISATASDKIVIAEGAQAQLEQLGDLKMYRVPMRVNVAAQSQKQVAMINQPESIFTRIHTANMGYGSTTPQPMAFLLRSKNVKEQGLGVALPAGSIALFEPAAKRSLLVGEYPMSDLAVGEDVEFNFGTNPDVQWTLTRMVEKDNKTQVWQVGISNARDVPVEVELIMPYDFEGKPKDLKRGQGGWIVPVTVPANGEIKVDYRLKLQ